MTSMTPPPVLLVLGRCHFAATNTDTASVSAAAAVPVLTTAQRRLLQRLAIAAPHSVRPVELAEAMWDGDPPNHLKATIQNQVSRIRAAHGESVVITTEDGYRLGVATDAGQLSEFATAAERCLEEDDARPAFDLADMAVRIGGSRAYPDLDHLAGIDTMRRAILATHRGAENLRLEAALRLGRHSWCLAEAERLAGVSPLDERRQSMLARALALAGRRGDAMAVILAARRALSDELGIDTGELIELVEAEILRPPGRERPTRMRSFVGRRPELRAVLAAIARRQIVEVTGEPGIGVTRLLSEARARLRELGLRPILIAAHDHQDAAAGVLRAILAELDLVPGPLGLVAGFVDALQGLQLPDGPVAIIVDDADLLGPTTHGVLAQAAQLEHVRLVLGAHDRSHGTGGLSAAGGLSEIGEVQVQLVPLRREHVARIALGQGRSLDASELDRLTADSGGNPAVLEILLDQGPGTTLGAMVDQWLAGLTPTQRAYVEQAAVAGDGFPCALLNPAESPVPTLITTARDGGIQFRHGALRDEIRQRLLPARREELHAQLGIAARNADCPVHLAARHLIAAGTLAGVEAVGACRQAAAESTRQGAHADAATWLSRAGEVDGMPYAERVAIQIELGDALRLAGDPAHLEVARDALDQALGLGDEQLIAAACFALLQLGATSSSGTPNSDLDPLLERAFATLQSPALRAPVLGAASLAWSLSGDAARCREYFNAADELAGTGPDRARILPFAYMALGLPGDLDRRRTAARELLACGAELSDPVLQFEGWQLTFSVALQDGDGEGVRSAQKEMDALVDQVGDVGRRWARHFCLAAVAHLDGNEDASEQFAGEAYAIFAPVSPPRALAAYTGQLFAIRMTQGRLAELAEPLASLVQDQPGIPAWHAAYAVASASAGGDPDTIALHADRAIDLAQPDATWLAAHAVGARAVAMIGAESLARRYVDLLEPWTGRMVWQGTCTYGPVDTALAMLHHALGDDDKARHHLVRAREGIERLDASPFAKELDAWAAAT